ncbi:MAG: HPr family phosphocarrier protein [Oscillospiraceae bacterium]|nr:HPr family phosphocarrier protein [Oscillospiraceae bacterium]
MKEYKILLSSINDVKEFVSITNDCPFEIDVISGRYAVDAKSIMGIFSLDLEKTLTVNVHGDEKQCLDFEYEVKKFMVD